MFTNAGPWTYRIPSPTTDISEDRRTHLSWTSPIPFKTRRPSFSARSAQPSSTSQSASQTTGSSPSTPEKNYIQGSYPDTCSINSQGSGLRLKVNAPYQSASWSPLENQILLLGPESRFSQYQPSSLPANVWDSPSTKLAPSPCDRQIMRRLSANQHLRTEIDQDHQNLDMHLTSPRNDAAALQEQQYLSTSAKQRARMSATGLDEKIEWLPRSRSQSGGTSISASSASQAQIPWTLDSGLGSNSYRAAMEENYAATLRERERMAFESARMGTAASPSNRSGQYRPVATARHLSSGESENAQPKQRSMAFHWGYPGSGNIPPRFLATSLESEEDHQPMYEPALESSMASRDYSERAGRGLLSPDTLDRLHRDRRYSINDFTPIERHQPGVSADALAASLNANIPQHPPQGSMSGLEAAYKRLHEDESDRAKLSRTPSHVSLDPSLIQAEVFIPRQQPWMGPESIDLDRRFNALGVQDTNARGRADAWAGSANPWFIEAIEGAKSSASNTLPAKTVTGLSIPASNASESEPGTETAVKTPSSLPTRRTTAWGEFGAASPAALATGTPAIPEMVRPYDVNALGLSRSSVSVDPSLSDPTAFADVGKGISIDEIPIDARFISVGFKHSRSDLFFFPSLPRARAGSTRNVRATSHRPRDPSPLPADLAALCKDGSLKVGSWVIVEGDRGRDIGQVTNAGIPYADVKHYEASRRRPTALHDSSGKDLHHLATSSSGQGAALGVQRASEKSFNVKRVYRFARDAEIAALADQRAAEEEAMTTCQAKISQKRLPMQLVDAEMQWDRRKLTFLYMADRRIDFRDLVKDLFRLYKQRIWLLDVSSL